mmetsp:Transcript_10431/g.19166  ORF Transcript_10431/g.19166 Transcript_10431/m.19166 type:complete len:218 (-) Transcript_10431:797-1450(-)
MPSIFSKAPSSCSFAAAFFLLRSKAILRGVENLCSGPLSMLMSAFNSKSFWIMSTLFCITASCTGVLPPNAGMSRFALRAFKVSKTPASSFSTATCIGADPPLLFAFKSPLASIKALMAPDSPAPQALCRGVNPCFVLRDMLGPQPRRAVTAFSALAEPAAKYRAEKPALSWKSTFAFLSRSKRMASTEPASAAPSNAVRPSSTNSILNSSSSPPVQ